jgi:hypothetical protein
MSKYELLDFSSETLELTRQSWLEMLDEDVFESELSPAFEWAGMHMKHIDGDSVALQMLDTESKMAVAIVEVVTSRKGQMFKMLKVIPSPAFWDVDNCRKEIIDLYIGVFMNVITSNGFKSNHKVKIYGRDDAMLSILRSIHSMWPVGKGKADFEGRFFAITWE